jgi:uncharacterized protein YycO
MSNDSPLRKLDPCDVATVVNLANHIGRLRVEAVALQQTFETRDRGYFTPSEDDLVLHLWVSYHKSRSALLELIDSVQRSVGHASDEHAGEFAVAYGAALILVDAARNLRNLFGEDEIVRRKLNESFLPYGIPENSFDAIQMSLTDPTNALRLKAANQFYDDHRELLHSLSQQDHGLRAVLEVVDGLRESARVTTATYLKARVKDRRRDARERVLMGSFSRAIYVVQEWGSRLVSNISTKPRHVARLPEAIVGQLDGILRAGDVLVTRKDSAVTNYFLPGYWPHAALYVGDGHVVESLKDGVRQRTMDSPFGNDAVAVIRPKLDAPAVAKAIERAGTHVGKPYDFDFDFTRADRIVCTEVVYRSYDGLAGVHFQLKRRAGRETLSAEDLLNLAIAGSFFEQVAVYCPQCSSKLLVSDQMTAVLRQTMAEPVL